jgi:CelD/BcsL family acetyltransferase involved in cellulose biosynthesis
MNQDRRDPLRTTVLTTERDVAALEVAWCDLYQRSREVTPFQSWAWLYSWWEHYGEGRQPYLIAVWQGDALVGLLPFFMDRLGGLRRLAFIGTGISDHLDIIVKDGLRDRVVAAAVHVLMRDPSWQVLDLHDLRPQAVAWDLVRRWPALKAIGSQDDCPIIDANSPDAVLPELSRNHRSSLRRSLRRAESEGISCELVGAADAEQAGRRLVTLHRELWQGRTIVPEHLTDRFEAHLAVAARRLSAAGLGGVSEFRRGGEVILSSLLMFGGGVVSTYLQGAGRNTVAEYQISSLYIWDALKRAEERNLTGVSLLRGREAYKLRWSSTISSNQRAILGRSRLAWAPYAACQLGYARLRRFVLSADAPHWVRRLAERYKALRMARRTRRSIFGQPAFTNNEELS